MVNVLYTKKCTFSAFLISDYSDLCLNPTEFSSVGLMSFEHNPKVVHYTCGQGFTLKGPPKQECTKNGTWDPPEVPSCVSTKYGKGFYFCIIIYG